MRGTDRLFNVARAIEPGLRRTLLHLIVPEGSEDEVHLDEDAAEGQQAAHEADHPRLQVELRGNRRRRWLHATDVTRN